MPTLAPHLAVQITVAEPTVVGSLAVFPLIADRAPSVRYVSFAEAVQRGATVKELGGGASVNDLIVHNPLDVPVLLYEGEEVLGAQQNRTFDVSALVAATLGAAGAGQLRRGGPLGRSAPRRGVRPGAADSQSAAAPDEEHAGASERCRRPGGARDSGRGLAGGGRHGRSPRRELAHRCDARRIRAPPRTAGRESRVLSRCTAARWGCSRRSAVASSCSTTSAKSRRSPRSTVRSFRAMRSTRSRLRTRAPPSIDDARDFIELLLDAPCTPGPAVGLGEGLRFAFGGLAGTGLICEGELVTLTAFADEPGQRRPGSRRPRPPSLPSPAAVTTSPVKRPAGRASSRSSIASHNARSSAEGRPIRNAERTGPPLLDVIVGASTDPT